MAEQPAVVTAQDLIRWSESLAGIARTGLGFTQSLYEQERYEEVLKVAADIKAAADHDIIPEMYVALPCKLFPGKIGDPTGAIPMVGYGAGAYILHLLERERAASPLR